LEQAKDIYKSKYWNTLRCDSLASGVDYTCFDYGVLSGIGRPQKALTKFSNLKGAALINAINDERQAFLNAIGVGKNAKFLRGWTNRVSRVRNDSLRLSKRPNVTAGPAIATGTIAAGVTLSQYLHQHETIIIAGAALVAIAIGFLVHHYLNKGK
jgi:lysozyme family protein